MSGRCNSFLFGFSMYIGHVSLLHDQSQYNPPRMVRFSDPSSFSPDPMFCRFCLSGRRGNASLRLPRCDNTSLNAPGQNPHRDYVLAIFFVISHYPLSLSPPGSSVPYCSLCQCKLYTSMILAMAHSFLLDTVHLGLSHICAWVSSPGSQHAISPICQGTNTKNTMGVLQSKAFK